MILSQLPNLPKFLNFTKFTKIKTDAIMKYIAPEFDIYEVVAERGYGDSEVGGGGTAAPGYDTEGDSLYFPN